MSQKLSFKYKLEEYSGYIVSSRTRLPFYHWFILDDGLSYCGADEFVFTEDMSGLKPLDNFFAVTHADFFAIIKPLIEKHISEETEQQSVAQMV